MVIQQLFLTFFISLSLTKLVGQQIPYRIFTMQDGLTQMKISDLHFDTRGILWVGTRNGLNSFNGEDFTSYTVEDGLLHNRIHAINEDSSGRLLILTYLGLNIFDGANFLSYPKDCIQVQYDLIIDKNERIWICERETGTIFEFRHDSFYQFSSSELDDNKSVPIKLFFNQRDRSKYLITYGKVYRFEHDSLEFLTRGSILPHQEEIQGAPFFMRTIDGKQYAYTPEEDSLVKISRIEPDRIVSLNAQFQFIKYAPETSTLFLPNGKVLSNVFFGFQCAITGPEGNYWIGAENGLGVIYNSSLISYPQEQLPYIWSFIENAEGELYFASYGHSLFKFNERGDITAVPLDPTLHISPFFHAGSTRDTRGNLYFTNSQGLLIAKNDSVRYIYNRPTFHVDYHPVRKEIIFGTLDGIGIMNESGEIQLYSSREGIHLCHYIQATGIDMHGNYWAASYNGLSRLDPGSGVIRNYTFEAGNLPSKGVYAISTDASGRLWFGSDDGLLYYDESSDSIRLLRSEEVRDIVKSLLALEEDKLLIGVKNGIYLFDAGDYFKTGRQSYYRINASNGYLGMEPGFTGFYKDHKGMIWTSSASGVHVINPSNIKLDNQWLKARFVLKNGNRIPFHHTDTIYNLPFKSSDILLDLEAIGVDRPARVKFQYKLNNTPWSSWRDTKQIFLQDLSEGNHRILLKAGPTDGEPDPSMIDQLRFKIDLAFYQHSLFPPIIIALATLLLSGFLINYWRQKRSARKYQAAVEQSRYLRSQLLLSEMQPHFVFNILASTQHKILHAQRREANDSLVKLSKLMRNFLNITHKANIYQEQYTDIEISLDDELELLRSFIEFSQETNNNHFRYTINLEGISHPENIYLPPMIIQPFVENAIKHGLLPKSDPGFLEITFTYIKGMLKITIEDDGVGIKEAAHERKVRYKTHQSLGTRIVEERIGLLNTMGYAIQVNTISREPDGTRIVIEIKDEMQ